MPTALAALPSNHIGTSWDARYGIVGMVAFDNPQWLLDGMNTEGLSAHLLYMPGACTYQPYRGDGSDVSEVDLIAYLLGTCASVADVVTAMAKISVWGVDPGMGFVPPVHCLLHDARSSIAIEFHPDGHTVVDNPFGVATNSPYLDWHLTNVANYVGLASTNPQTLTINGHAVSAAGQGQGMRGMPGDWTPPSRFIRALAQVVASDQPKDGHESELLALHILNTFDIIPGLIREAGPDGMLVDEVTVWSTIVNLSDLRYAYRTNDDPTTYAVDLRMTDFTAPARVQPLSWAGDFAPVAI